MQMFVLLASVSQKALFSWYVIEQIFNEISSPNLSNKVSRVCPLCISQGWQALIWVQAAASLLPI